MDRAPDPPGPGADSGFVRFAAIRGRQLRRPLAERLVKAARDGSTTADAAVARRVLAADLALLAELSAEIDAAEAEFARLLPLSPFETLTTTPGWVWSGLATMPGRWVTRSVGPGPHRSTGPPVCPRPSMSRQANDAMEPSAGKAAWRCAGP